MPRTERAYVKAFGDRVRQMRKLRKLSQEKLGELAGISTNFVSEIELGKGNPSITVIRKLATGLQTTAAFLIDGEHEDTATREVNALLASRSAVERQMVLRLVRALFAGS